MTILLIALIILCSILLYFVNIILLDLFIVFVALAYLLYSIW